MKKLTVTILICLLFVISSNIIAKSYVSFKGRFAIEYPENWEKLDYNLVDLYLSRTIPDETNDAYNYDAVFSTDTTEMFYTHEYLFLRYDKINKMSQKKIDSVLNILTTSYSKSSFELSIEEAVVNPFLNQPYYDKKTETILILREIELGNNEIKYNLMFYKFTDSGLVTFFFYAPQKSYKEYKNVFYDIYKSFTTENLEAKFPEEDVKIADLELSADADENNGGLNTGAFLAIFGAVIVIMILIIMIRKKKKN